MWLALSFLFFSHHHIFLKSQYDRDPTSYAFCSCHFLLGPFGKVMESVDLLTEVWLSHWGV